MIHRLLAVPGRPGVGRKKRGAVLIGLLALAAGSAVYAAAPSAHLADPMLASRVGPVGIAANAGRIAEPGADVASLQERAARARQLVERTRQVYDREVAPIKRVLLRYSGDRELVDRIAVSLVRESRHVGLEPRLLLAVLLVENPWLDPVIRSSVGAVGLMQVMPLHRGQWEPCAPDLEDVEDNICHGARIFAHYFERSGGDIEEALLRYNGCVRGTNTPNCHEYPYHVFARAGRAHVLAWLEPEPTRAAAP